MTAQYLHFIRNKISMASTIKVDMERAKSDNEMTIKQSVESNQKQFGPFFVLSANVLFMKTPKIEG